MAGHRASMQSSQKASGTMAQALSNRRRRGFTLIELMITVAVLAILIALAAPSFKEFFEKARLRGAVDDVVALLNKSRAEAVKRDRNVTVNLGGSGGTDWCVGANAATEPAANAMAPPAATCDCTDAAECLIGTERVVVTAGDQYRGVSLSATAGSLTFDRKLGTLQNLAAGTIITATSESGRFDLQFQVQPLGHVRVCIPAGKPPFGNYPPC